jgi:hypothetical protein
MCLPSGLVLLSMSSGPSGWLPLVFATLGAGVTGSLIATYGSQAAERRRARSGVIASLQKLEGDRRRRATKERFDFSGEDLANLETQCILARLPRYLVATYRLANEAAKTEFECKDIKFETSSDGMLHRQTGFLCDAFIQHSAELLAANIWHPWLTALYVYIGNKRLLAAIHEVFPTVGLSGGEFKFRLRRWRRDSEKVQQWQDLKWKNLEKEWQDTDSDES